MRNIRYFKIFILILLLFPAINEASLVNNTFSDISNCEGKLSLHLVRTWGGDETEDENQFFRFPRDVVISDKNGNVYILDSANNRIQVFNRAGKFIRTIGRHGQGPGDLSQPTAFDLSKDQNIFVCDYGNIRFQVFDTAGRSLNTFKYMNKSPENIAINNKNEILFCSNDSKSDKLIYVLDSTGKLLREIGKYHKKRLTHRESIFFDLGPEYITILYYATPYFRVYTHDGKPLLTVSFNVFPELPVLKWDKSINAPENVNIYKCQVSAGLDIDDANRIFVMGITRRPKKNERFFLTDPGVRYPKEPESTNTDRFKLLVFDINGKIIASKQMDVFCDNIYIHEDRLFVIDTYMGQVIYEYKISFNKGLK